MPQYGREPQLSPPPPQPPPPPPLLPQLLPPLPQLPPPPPPPPPPVLKPVHEEAAYFPLRSSHSVSYSTSCPSSRYALRSSPLTLRCTNTSSDPSSGVMKPNPFSSKNFFTTPLGTH